MPSDYYAILQVAPDAEQEIIDAAYRCLAWKYHPDVNRSPEAAERMKGINQAYEVLGDRVKRAEYEQARTGEPIAAAEGEAGAARVPMAPPFTCEECGRIDESLRAAVFHYVVSLVVVSFQRSGGGVLCRSCRIKDSIIHSLISLVLGPWGLPWGPFWALRAFWIDARGGQQPADINAPLLNLLGRYFASVGKNAQAVRALQASLHYQPNPDVEQSLRRAREEWASERQRRPSAPEKEQAAAPSGGLLAAPAERILKSRWLNFAELRWVMLVGGILYVIVLLTLVAFIYDALSERTNLAAADSPTFTPAPALEGTALVAETPTLAVEGTPFVADTATPEPPAATGTTGPTSALANVIPLPPQQIKTCVDLANVRGGPGTDYPITRQLDAGSTVSVYGAAGEWYYVGRDEAKGEQFMNQSTLCAAPSAAGGPAALAQDSPFAVTPGPRPTSAPVCASYQFVCTSVACRNRVSGNPPVRGIQRPNGPRVFFDMNHAEYWDPNELGKTRYFNCPAEAAAAGYVDAHAE